MVLYAFPAHESVLYVGHYLVSSTGDAGWTESCDRVPHFWVTKRPQTVWWAEDSRTVAMKVGIR